VADTSSSDKIVDGGKVVQGGAGRATVVDKRIATSLVVNETISSRLSGAIESTPVLEE
jgi:hypothetical protein